MTKTSELSEKRKNINHKENPSFWSNALALQGSVTPKVYLNVLFCMVYALFIALISRQYALIQLPISPFEYAGVIMGLALVFRVNSGYDRWWEARKIWGDIVNAVRNLSILVKSYSKDMEKGRVEETLNLIAALPILIKNHLRSIEITEETKDLLSAQDYLELQNWNHRPNFISLRIAENLSFMYDHKKINEFSFLKAEHVRQLLIDSQGACERILKTPMPLVMAIKIRRLIFLFLLVLPLALADSVLIDVCVTGLVAYALFSLDQIGIELQNPFGVDNLSHLPLNDICSNIQKDIAEISTRTQPSQQN